MTGTVAAGALVAAARELAATRGVLGPVPGWSGAAARAAAGRMRVLRGEVEDWVDDVRVVATLLAAAGGDAGRPGGAAGGETGAGTAAARSADAALAAALDAAGRLPTDGAAPPAVPAGAPDASSPAAVAAWWAGLDEPAREALRRARPDLVGGLDGLPARERDRANRARLDRARDEALAQQRADLLRLATVRGPGDLALIGVRLMEVHRRLERLGAVAASLTSPAPGGGRAAAFARPGRELLAFDTSPGHAVTAAVATGDVDTARDVAVLTPGFTADVRDLPETLGELDGVATGAGPGTAAVAWYGYEAPQWSGVADPRRSVASPAPAEVGAQRLSRFLGGLDAAHGGPAGRADPHLTVLGHSYGSLVAARAVSRSPEVDDAVYLGSPGLGGPAPGPAGHAWVAEAAGDPVADLGWFGPDPNREPDAGGLSAAAGPDGGEASHGHSDYLRAGTTSARNVAAVVGGRPDAVVRDHGVGVGDRLRALLG